MRESNHVQRKGKSDTTKRNVTGDKKMTAYKVVKIGWENGNDGMNIVLVSKKDRTLLAVDIASGVHVKKGNKKVVALVERQFKEFVGQENVATINQKLATALGATVGDIIEIEGGVTESEWAAFEQTMPRVHPMAMLLNALAAGRTPRDPQSEPQVGGHE
jgi:hypothetical protein